MPEGGRRRKVAEKNRIVLCLDGGGKRRGPIVMTFETTCFFLDFLRSRSASFSLLSFLTAPLAFPFKPTATYINLFLTALRAAYNCRKT